MRTLLVTGASGFVGAYLLRAAEAQWPRVILVSRRDHAAPGTKFCWLLADLAEDKLAVAHADAVIHLAPLPLLPKHIPALQAFGVRRIVAVGTTSRLTKVHSPSRLDRNIVAEYTQAENEFVRLCERYHVAWTLLRATMVYDGRSDKNIRVIARVIRRIGFFPVAGQARGLRQPLHAQDLAAACLTVADQPQTFGCIYSLAGTERLTYREMVKRVFRAMRRRPRILSVPRWIYRAILTGIALHPRYRYLTPAMADRMDQDMVFDISTAQRDFGFAPRPFQPELTPD